MASYSSEEVEALLEGYIELDRNKLWILVRMADLEKHLSKVPPKYLEALFLLGIMGCSTRMAAEMSGVSHSTIWVRYTRGVMYLTEKLNGRIPWEGQLLSQSI